MNGEKKEKYVHEVFDTIAGKYDFMNVVMTWGMLKRWQRIVMDKTELRPGGKGLDVCCGTGEMTYQQAKIVGSFGQAVGLDFSPNMLENAEKKRADYPNCNVQFVEGDALNLPFPDDSFNAATNGFALRNVSDIPKAIREMARVVEVGGRVVCIDVSRPSFPPARWFFNLYYFKIVPWLGSHLVSGQTISNGYPAYTWLAESLRTFPPREEIAQMFRDAGLTSVEVQPVGFGAATIYSGIKTNADHAFDAVPKHHPIYNAALKGRSVLSKLTDKKR
ncbi:MAG: bifunctional demethylmenaquinone methyltransferase/2-methoxy-6-polyprenyl-1,4-benzoquinol methylase UbiE [Peptococcaceae bacterium]|jgi:demethylmenaquinone methyltransferase/2-methoxy-6-polyprenyl-1,4-benzoquinol methylase|nr:bifunctional demethylmenaquinone methyltransferase/2-methoxy-6-polyprenyl-1,4-benzoquinol methylase UbiE [Peptococcaceae bacterium]